MRVLALQDRRARPWPVVLLVLVCALVLFVSNARAQSFPAFTGFVTDAANIIPPADETALTTKLSALQKSNGRQLVVATIPDLQGYAIEDYGYRLGRSWQVGQKGLDNGAILIVAPVERKVRIEVGYGVTPVITDALSSVIINSQILPAFKAGNMTGGITAGAAALLEQLSLPDAQAQAKAIAAAREFDRQKQGREGGAPLSLVFWGIVLAFVLLSMLRRRGGGGRRFRGGGAPVILWGPGFGGGGGWGGGSGGGSTGGGWMGGGFSGGGGGSFGGGGASGSW